MIILKQSIIAIFYTNIEEIPITIFYTHIASNNAWVIMQCYIIGSIIQ